ncbi:MAG: hypothetical protein KAW84_08730 [Thermoplasmata archaeon]|nr:hypothetical protein [Thermoplasmata archaeon]
MEHNSWYGTVLSGLLLIYKKGELVEKALDDLLLAFGLPMAYLGIVGSTFFLIMGLWLGGWILCAPCLVASTGVFVIVALQLRKRVKLSRGLW